MPTESSHLRILFEALSKATKIPSGPRIWMRFFCRENMRVRPRQGHNGPHTRVVLRTHQATRGHKRGLFMPQATTDQERVIVFLTECWRSIPFEALSEGH